MSRRCDLTGVGVQFGNKVSHSERKTRRCFRPNLRVVKYKSDFTGQEYRFKVAAKCLRTIEQVGGFDNFMLKAKAYKMSEQARAVKREIVKREIIKSQEVAA